MHLNAWRTTAMDKPDFPTPRSGDVLFTCEKGFARWASVQVQDRADPLARSSREKFTHVALAISDTMAVEAVPAPVTEADAASRGAIARFLARHAASRDVKKKVHLTAWTDVPLSFGVRCIPIADILVDARSQRFGLKVLRNKSSTPPDEALRPALAGDDRADRQRVLGRKPENFDGSLPHAG
jgi:hypothetical protein